MSLRLLLIRGRLLDAAYPNATPLEVRCRDAREDRIRCPSRPCAKMEQSSEFFVSLRARPTYSGRRSCVYAVGRPQGFSGKAEYLSAGAGGGAVRGDLLTEARDRAGSAKSDKGGPHRKPRDVGD